MSATATTAPASNSVLFGVTDTSLASSIQGSGITPSAMTSTAINAHNQVVCVFENSNRSGLYYGLATMNGLLFDWSTMNGYVNKAGKNSPNSGYNPAVVIDNSGNVLEMHDSGGLTADLWYWIGKVQTSSGAASIEWTTNEKINNNYSSLGGSGGYTPSLALNAAGHLVEIHVNNETAIGNSFYYWIGTFSDGALTWVKNASMNNSGINPSVSLTNSDVVVHVHDDGAGGLWYMLGVLDLSTPTINWTAAATSYGSGSNPTVIVTDDYYVFEAHQSKLGTGLWQQIGQIQFNVQNEPVSIQWIDFLGQNASDYSYQFDYGEYVVAACNNVLSQSTTSTNALAVQTHLNNVQTGYVNGMPVYTPYLFATASAVFDRGNWMGDNLLFPFGSKPLNQVVVPGSHDAGMYMGGTIFDPVQDAAKTQDLNFYGQLLAGVRWFDVRPLLIGSTFYIHHSIVLGPPLSQVLSNVAQFMQQGRRELVVLKFSHYAAVVHAIPQTFDQDDLNSLCSTITQALSPWLFTGTIPPGQRLAQMALSQLIGPQGTVLVVCDGQAGDNPLSVDKEQYPGIYNYRDWNSSDPQDGDLNVFDLYSDTRTLSTMMYSLQQDGSVTTIAMPNGQQPKFEGGTVTNPPAGVPASWGGYNGVCLNGTTPCDLFLLSWTLTTDPDVWAGAQQADACLVGITSGGPSAKNKNGQTSNILYTDYVEYSRSADVAYYLNGLLAG